MFFHFCGIFCYVFPDIVLFYVMFAGGGIAVSVLEMENVYDIQFGTCVRSCGFTITSFSGKQT